MRLCDLCEEKPTTIDALSGLDWQLCDDCYNDIVFDPPPTCAECGQALSSDDVEAGEDTCVECQAIELDRTPVL